jgi:hypothetical protein
VTGEEESTSMGWEVSEPRGKYPDARSEGGIIVRIRSTIAARAIAVSSVVLLGVVHGTVFDMVPSMMSPIFIISSRY